jgi:hypothetical protein
MAAPINLNLVAWQAVAAGNRAYLDLPLDRDYLDISIRAGATGVTDALNAIDRVRIVVNGIAIRELTPAQIRRLNLKYGTIYNATDLGLLTLNFQEVWLWNHIGADSLALFTYGLLSLRIEVDIKPGLTAPFLGGYASAKVQRQVAPGANIVRKTKIETLDFPAAGTKIFRNLSPAGLVKAYNLQSNTVTQVKYRIAGTEVWNLLQADCQDIMRRNWQTPDNNWYHLAWDTDLTFDAGIMAAALKETEFEVTVSAAGIVLLIHEYYDPIA